VPKAAFGVHELDGHLVLAPVVGLNVHDTAFPLFFCEAVHQQNCLALTHTRCQGKQSAVSAYQLRLGDVSERMVVQGASVNAHWYAQGKALAASLFFYLACQTSIRLTLSVGLGNSTCAHLAQTAIGKKYVIHIAGLNRSQS